MYTITIYFTLIRNLFNLFTLLIRIIYNKYNNTPFFTYLTWNFFFTFNLLHIHKKGYWIFACCWFCSILYLYSISLHFLFILFIVSVKTHTLFYIFTCNYTLYLRLIYCIYTKKDISCLLSILLYFYILIIR